MMQKKFSDYVRVAAATPKIEVANCAYNADRIIELMKRAHAEGVHLLCLPELCITGATCGDLFLQSTLINSTKAALAKIVAASQSTDMVVVVGLPLAHKGRLYNVAAVLSQGKILGYVPKTNVSKPFVKLSESCWREEDGAALSPDMIFTCESSPNFKFAVEIGTDLFMPIPPSTRYVMNGANIVVNIAATSEFVGKPDFRRSVVSAQSARLECGYVYANAGHGESTTDTVFGGHSIIAENGTILQEAQPFGNGWAVSEIDLAALAHARQIDVPTVKPEEYVKFTFPAVDILLSCETLTRRIDPLPFAKGAEEALAIQTAGLVKRLSHTNSIAVIGISGGLDSCLALLVTVRAYELLGKPVSEIIAVTMPCFGTTAHTKNNAHRLCEALGAHCREIDITASVTQHLKDINHPPDKHDIVFENAQARMRTYVLMDLANQVNGLVVGTGSLSELALGWATYNGDHMSMYAVNAGVPKTLVRHTVEHIADISDDVDLKKVLNSILATKVSPELLPAHNNGEISQVTEDLVGPYELHDFFIYHTLRFCRRPKAIFHLAQLAFGGKYTPEEILHWQRTFYRRFFSQQFKRSCMPDGPQVVEISLSPRGGFQMPSDASADAWLRELDEINWS